MSATAQVINTAHEFKLLCCRHKFLSQKLLSSGRLQEIRVGSRRMTSLTKSVAFNICKFEIQEEGLLGHMNFAIADR